MTFEEILDQAITMLQRRGRLTYGALKRQFQLDDAYLEDVKAELIEGQRVAIDEDGRVLVWTGRADVPPLPPQLGPLPATTDFQPIQGLPLPAAPQSADAERRQLTVMFCDLVDSTRLAKQLDPEDWRDIVRAYQQTCADVIQRYEGHIAQYLGDGLLVYFGYPQAHEDDAQRAVRTGLGMLDAMGTLNTRLEREQGVRLAVRVGMHTGLVVVGKMGGGSHQEQLALGDTPNVAARLQGLAEPDTVAISEVTYRLTEGYFTCEALGVQTLKGASHSMPVYRVRGESITQSRLELAARRGLTPLVGREQEVELLYARWGQVQDGHGQTVLLSGEAGIGKSRLVRVLKDHVAGEPHTRLECRSSPYYRNTALYPITDLLHRTLQWQPADAPEARLAKLEQVLQQYRLSLEESIPLFARLLSLAVPEERYTPLNLTPQRQRQKTLEAIVAILLEQAEGQPVLFIVEDLHWSDPSTLELLAVLIDQVPTAKILTLLTCRPEFQPPWGLRSHLTPLALHRFTGPQVGAMVKRVLGGKIIPAEVMQHLVEKTDGVPLYIEEMTQAILESGVLQATNGHYELTGSLTSLAIPTTLQNALMARLDRLGTAKSIAQLGATLGRTFPYELLQVVSSLEAPVVWQHLVALVKAELLYQRGSFPQATFTFKHALIQDIAYQSLLRSARQQYHQQIAQVLVERFPETVATQPELVAHHYTEAGLSEPAVVYWQQAGQRALERAANREAVACLERGLEALSHLPQNHATLEQAVDLRLALRTALVPLGDFGRLLAYLREAEALAAALDDPRRLGRVSYFLSNYFRIMGAPDQAIAAAQRALALAMVSGDVVLHVLANLYLGFAYHAQDDYRRAIDYLGQTVACLDGARRREYLGQVFLPAVQSRAHLALCHAELGMFAEGNALGTEGLRIAEAIAHPANLMVASWGIGLLALRQGALRRALALLERAMGICQDADLPVYFPRLAAALGAAYTLAGRDAVPLLTQAMEQTMPMERVGFQGFCLLPLGEAYLLADRREEAHALTERALASARERQERGNQAYALHLLGNIAARREPLGIESAEAHYQQALALAGELSMRPLQAHCHRDLGTLYDQTGRHALARAALSTAIELYRAMDMIFWLPATEARLAQVEG